MEQKIWKSVQNSACPMHMRICEGEPNLELRVIVLNVNEGCNRKLMEHCQVLKEYAQYVAKVRRYTAEMELDAAVKRAVEECIAEGILEDFFEGKPCGGGNGEYTGVRQGL